jgi:uncharacterized integral membrane protein
LARLLAWLIGPPAAMLVATFAVANRQALTLELWPLPWSVELPTYLAVLGALMLGLVLGMAVMAGALVRARRRAGTERRRAQSLARQLDAAEASGLPAIPGQTPP